MNTCQICGGPLGLSLFGNPTCGVCYGTGAAHQAALGSAAASQYAGLGALNAQQNTLYNAAIQNTLAQQSALYNSGLGNFLGSQYPTTPTAPLEHCGTTFGELVGWRIWGLLRGYLTSYSANYAWLPGHPAEGQVTDHGNGGVWAFKEPGQALKKALDSVSANNVEGWVVGSIWMYGEIIEHTGGYRSQYAMLRSLETVIPNEPQSGWRKWTERGGRRKQSAAMLVELRERYGVKLAD